MSPTRIVCFFALLHASVLAKEVTIEERLWVIPARFDARVMPKESAVSLAVAPKAWTDFRLLKIVDHGAVVAKGDRIATFDPRDIDRALENARRALAKGQLAFRAAEQELAHLKATAPHRIEATRIAAETAKEEYRYFTETRRKSSEDASVEKLANRRQFLENEKEELRQLTKMYEADDLTEETEEIILVRQKDAVKSAEFRLHLETLEHERTVKVQLPREAISLANAERDKALALQKLEQDIPREIETQEALVAALKTEVQRKQVWLSDLEHDRGLFDIKAPANGICYYGSIENGRWACPSELIKSLSPNGSPPLHRPFATWIPHDSATHFVGFTEASIARMLSQKLAGRALLKGREDLEIPVSITHVAKVPEPDGTYAVQISAKWPHDHACAIGDTATLHFIAYQNPKAILVPDKALVYGPLGWTADVMLTDGKTERRSIQRGRSFGEETEILSGLEIGQVIIAP